jgi:hypothetical protein
VPIDSANPPLSAIHSKTLAAIVGQYGQKISPPLPVWLSFRLYFGRRFPVSPVNG